MIKLWYKENIGIEIGNFIIILFILIKFLITLKIKNKYIHLSTYLFVLIYIFILNMSIAALRSFIFSLFSFINKKFLKKKFFSLNLLSFTMIIFFFFNPYIVYSFSFIFTFVMSFLILILNTSLSKKFKKIKFVK